MKGDATNLTRAMLARLSVASALISVVCFVVFIAGNFGTLSGQALTVASYGMGVSGFAAVSFALASLVTTLMAPLAGARLFISTLVIAIVAGLLGVAAILGSGIAGAITRGLSF